jgi:hypothetical protein
VLIKSFNLHSNYFNSVLNKPNSKILKTIPEYYKTKGGFKWCDKSNTYVTTPPRLNIRWYKHNQ